MGKILCNVCRKKCKGDVLKVNTNYIHKECFCCYKCKTDLEKGGFYVKDNKYYCAKDYQDEFGTKCGICHKFVEGEVIIVLGKSFHKECFCCQYCKKSFQSRERVALWNGIYLCKRCLNHHQSTGFDKENTSPGCSSQGDTHPNRSASLPRPISNGHSEFDHTKNKQQSMTMSTPMPYGGRPISNGLSMSAVDCTPIAEPTTPINGALSVHVPESGYTSTEPPVMRAKRNYISEASPCYSLSSGDESGNCSRRSAGPLDNRDSTLNSSSRQWSKSFLTIEQEKDPSRDMSKRRETNSMRSESPARFQMHFHRPTGNFSYRASPKHGLNRRGFNDLTRSLPPTRRLKDGRTSHTSEDIRRMAAYPGGNDQSDTESEAAKSDWPSPSLSIPQLSQKDKVEERKSHALPNGDDIDGDNKSDTTLKELSSLASQSGLSQALLRDFTNQDGRKSPDLDPISASRTPNAASEPVYKTRYDKHLFASPSRDTHRDKRELHSLSYRMDYLNSSGSLGRVGSSPADHSLRKAGTLPTSIGGGIARAGYTQGYIGNNTRSTSLPRPPMDYSDNASEARTLPDMLSPHSPMTTSGISGFSMNTGDDAATLSGYEDRHSISTAATITLPRQSRPRDRNGYASSHGELSYSCASVQSWLKPSVFLHQPPKQPPKIYPYDTIKLSNKSLPKDVDYNKLETHLSDAEFQEHFKMTRAQFSRLPEWKKNDIKRRLELF